MAALLLELILIAMPPDGAGPLSVSLPVVVAPAVTDVGDTAKALTVQGLTVRLAETPAMEGEMAIVATVEVVTAVVWIVNVAVVAPTGTVTLVGVVALALFVVRSTVKPPVGAGPLMVSVPVVGVPPVTVDGEIDNPDGCGGLTVSVPVTCVEPSVPVIVTAVDFATAEVVIVKLAAVAPAATVTLDGTDPAEVLDARLTTVPPAGAAAPKVTVPVAEVPPVTLPGLTETPAKPWGKS